MLSGGGGAIPILGYFKLSLGMRTFPFKNPKDMEHNTIDKLCQFHDSQGISENQVLVYGWVILIQWNFGFQLKSSFLIGYV